MNFGKKKRQSEKIEYLAAEDIATGEGLEKYKRNFRGQVLMLINLQAEGRNETAEVLKALIGIGIYFKPTVDRKGRATLKMLPIIGKGYFQSIESWEQWRREMLKNEVVKRDMVHIVSKATSGCCRYDECALNKGYSEKDKEPQCQFKADCLFVNPKCEYAEQIFEQHYSAQKHRSIEKLT